MAIFDSRGRPAYVVSETRELVNDEVEVTRQVAERPAEGATSSSTTDDSAVTPQLKATAASVLLFLGGLYLTVEQLFGTNSGPTFTPAEGLGAFTLFYVAAQAAERLVEMALPPLDWIPDLGKKAMTKARDTAVAAALTEPTKDKAETASNAQAAVDQLRANRRVVTFAATAVLGMLLCGYLEADFLAAVGVSFGTSTDSEWVRMAVTGLVVGGGSAKLHDLITNMSKSNAERSDPAATGGRK